jgi:hypothetical protein
MRFLFGKLLQLANSNAPSGFYDFKREFLERNARRDGFDLQYIEKECWGEWNVWGDQGGCEGKGCPRCCGTGIFSRRYHLLERFEYAGRLFHIPRTDSVFRPAGPEGHEITIRGRIQHREVSPMVAEEAYLWLLLLCFELRCFYQAISTHAWCKPRFFPLLNLGRIVFYGRLKLGKCSKCDRRFFGKSRRCQRCQRKEAAECDSRIIEDIPF